jgi:CheY-like chemotaxis protein
MKVLIADDDRDLSQLLSTVLRSEGHEVVFAFDAAQALVVAKNTKPDVIILDINMPGGTGVGALEKLKINMKTSMIPVLVITASTDEQLARKIKQQGAAEFMQKPLDIEAFIDALHGITEVVTTSTAMKF